MKSRSTISWIRTSLVLCCLLGTLSAHAQTNGEYVSQSTQNTVDYTIPAWASLQGVSLTNPNNQTTQVSMTTGASIPATSDNFTAELYWESTAGHASFDRALVYSHGGYTYLSNPNLAPEQAAIIDLSTYNVLGYATVTRSGNSLTFSFSTSYVGTRVPGIALTRYLPAGTNVSDAYGGLGGAVVGTYEIDSYYFNNHATYVTPGHPDASSGGGLSAASSSSTDAIIGGGAIRHDIIIGDSCPPSGNVPRTTEC